jgi:heat shock protein HslJ
MTDLERAFAAALQRVDLIEPPVASLDPEELSARAGGAGGGRGWTGPARWLAAAAAVVLVAGIGIVGWVGSNSAPSSTPAGGSVTADSVNLVGPVWQVTEIDTQSVERAGGQVPWLQFLANGEVVGAGQCAGLQGTYRLDGDALGFDTSSLSSTNANCAAKQQQFLAALADNRRLALSGDQLQLLDASGQVRVVLQALAVVTGQGPPMTSAPGRSAPSPSAAAS